MKIDTDRVGKLLPAAISIIGVIDFTIVTWDGDPAYTDLAISGILMIASFLLWIILLLIDLNRHFEKLEEEEDSDVQE